MLYWHLTASVENWRQLWKDLTNIRYICPRLSWSWDGENFSVISHLLNYSVEMHRGGKSVCAVRIYDYFKVINIYCSHKYELYMCIKVKEQYVEMVRARTNSGYRTR